MAFKLLTVILVLTVVAETGYIILRRPTNRFQIVAGYNGFVALDTRDGRLCGTAPGKWPPASADATDEEKLIRALPTCWSLR